MSDDRMIQQIKNYLVCINTEVKTHADALLNLDLLHYKYKALNKSSGGLDDSRASEDPANKSAKIYFGIVERALNDMRRAFDTIQDLIKNEEKMLKVLEQQDSPS